MRTLLALMSVLALLLMACGDDDGTDTAATTASPDTTVEVEPETTVEPEASVEEFCEKNAELVEIRGQIYNQPFTETPEEIEALMAESDALFPELNALIPEEIEEQMLFHQEEFVKPIDAMTEELGWDPFAAINTPEAAAIFADPELQAAQEQVMPWLEENCDQAPM